MQRQMPTALLDSGPPRRRLTRLARAHRRRRPSRASVPTSWRSGRGGSGVVYRRGVVSVVVEQARMTRSRKRWAEENTPWQATSEGPDLRSLIRHEGSIQTGESARLDSVDRPPGGTRNHLEVDLGYTHNDAGPGRNVAG